MRHQNSVMHDLVQHIPWPAFERLVAEHGADARVRRLRARDHLIALLYGQLSGARSLREITAGLQSHSARLYHLGGRPVARSTLADAQAHRPCAVFAGLFAAMVQQAGRGARRAIGEVVHLIDSTTVSLSALSAEWARFSPAACGAKLHLVLDPDADRPVHAEITPSRVSDITAAQRMPITPGATYVFDLGYYDFAWWARLDDAGCRIVSRLKANTRLSDTVDQVLPEAVRTEGVILSDRIGRLPTRMARSRVNPFSDPLREVRVRLHTGQVLRIVSNDLDAPAQEIADLYKRRWAIELFFRWVKQTLRVTHFLGTSENAVRIQVIVALIAHMLLRQAQHAQNTVQSPLAFARLVRATLMHRRRLDQLLTHQPNPANTQQLLLQWT